MIDGAGLLARIEAAARTGQPLAGDDLVTLGTACRRWLEGDGTLDALLNLKRRSVAAIEQDRREHLFCEAAKRFFPGLSQRDQAEQLHSKLLLYRQGGWRVDRALDRYHGRPGTRTAAFWEILKHRDLVPADETIRDWLKRRSASG